MAIHHTVCFVLVIIVICNAVLYPTLFSSILRQWFGWKEPQKQPDSSPNFPPHMRGGMPNTARRPEFKSAHEASAYMAQQRQDGGGRGMMGTILPVYAIGIFVYFGYVIYKIFLREKPPQDQPQDIWGRPIRKVSQEMEQYEPTLERQQEEALQKKLSEQLKAENYNIPRRSEVNRKRRSENQEEVETLRERLAETEKTMEKMMEMMNNMGLAFSEVTKQITTNKKENADDDTESPRDSQERSEDGEVNTDSEGDIYEEDESIEETDGIAAPECISLPNEKGEGEKGVDDSTLDEGEIVEDISTMDNDEDSNVRRRHVTSDHDEVD